MTLVVPAGLARSADGTVVAYRTVGEGPPLLVVGGALRTSADYVALAQALGRRFTVHVLDRRGRGASGPRGPGDGIEEEVDDVLAVLDATGATRVFGHSYGGLVALEAAKRSHAIERLAVYEPGVSVGGSVRTDWICEYRLRLARGDERGAFAVFVRGSGHAPAIVSRLPLGYLRAVLRLVVRGEQWERMRPLLALNADEHDDVRRLADTVDTYAQVTADVLLLGGAKSPDPTRTTLDALDRVIVRAAVVQLAGLDHNAPDDHAPDRVAATLEPWFAAE